MTESMIERVRRAIVKSIEAQDVFWALSEDDKIVLPAVKLDMFLIAQDVIGAMREPTDRMIEAGYAADGYTPDPSDLRSGYSAMIDAALIWPAGSADRAGVPLARDQ